MYTINKLVELTSTYNVLYVEDDQDIAATVIQYLEKLFKKVVYSKNGKEGLASYSKENFHIVITDIQMPEMDGLEMSKKIKKINPEQNIIVISAYSNIEKFTNSIKIGIDGYILKPVDYDNLNSTLFKVANKIKKFQQHAEYEKNLKQLVDAKVKENLVLQDERIKNYEQTLFALIDMIENRDLYTGKHSLRVASYAKLIAKELSYSDRECEEIYKAGMLHDIGKVAIPDALLLKPGSLIKEEYTLIKEHVNIGFGILNQIPMLQKIARIINAHHERLDGSGYPKGLKKEQIPIESNILAIADSFDSMTSNRIYKRKKTIAEAISELESLSNIHYLKNVVDAATKVFKRVVLDEKIQQAPKTEIEKARFFYFYNDNLTGFYNYVYLDYILADNKVNSNYEYINIISINKFSEYNNTVGWAKGNDQLVNIANQLRLLFKSNDLFRIHRYNFILFSSNKNKFEKIKLKNFDKFLEDIDSSLSYSIKSLDILGEKIESETDLEKYLK